VTPRLVTCPRCHGAGEVDCTRGASRHRIARCSTCHGHGTVGGRPSGSLEEDQEPVPVSRRALHDLSGREL
jgi:hypothetical protein